MLILAKLNNSFYLECVELSDWPAVHLQAVVGPGPDQVLDELGRMLEVDISCRRERPRERERERNR